MSIHPLFSRNNHRCDTSGNCISAPKKHIHCGGQSLSTTFEQQYRMTLHTCLPLEIFQVILQLCVGSETPVRDISMLQLVCRSWHNIIASTSILWRTINAGEGLPAFQKSLQMAGESLLDLNFTINTSKIDQNDFFELAGAKVGQWRSLVVETRSWEAALKHLQTQKPPNLETLHLTGCHRPSVEDEIVLSVGDLATGLKDVRPTNARDHQASLHLSNLKSLHLSGIPSITVTDIIAILQQSPDLELLRLSSLEGAVMPTEPTGGQPNLPLHSPIRLPFLIKLHLSDLPFPFLNFLLSTLALSKLRTLNVICHVDEQSSIRSGVCRRNPTLLPARPDAQTYKITISTWCYYSISIGGLCIIVTFPDRLSMDHFDETFTWLGDLLGLTLAEKPLHLVLNDCNPELSYLEWFTHRTNLTNLTLSANSFFGSGLEGVIPFLSKPTPSPSSAWLLPQVEVFKTNLVHPQSKAQIAGMIQRRQSVRRESPTGHPVVSPKRFREIWLAYGGRDDPAPQVDEEFLLTVVRAAEGADVYWEGKKWVVSDNIFG